MEKVNTSNLTAEKIGGFTAGSKAEADDLLKDLLRTNPILGKTLLVVATDELEEVL